MYHVINWLLFKEPTVIGIVLGLVVDSEQDGMADKLSFFRSFLGYTTESPRDF